MLIKHALERSGDAQVEIVPSGDEALRAASQSQPDLLILDLNLPVLSGTEVCRVLRAQPATAQIPIIMLTARTQKRIASRGWIWRRRLHHQAVQPS